MTHVSISEYSVWSRWCPHIHWGQLTKIPKWFPFASTGKHAGAIYFSQTICLHLYRGSMFEDQRTTKRTKWPKNTTGPEDNTTTRPENWFFPRNVNFFPWSSYFFGTWVRSVLFSTWRCGGFVSTVCKPLYTPRRWMLGKFSRNVIFHSPTWSNNVQKALIIWNVDARLVVWFGNIQGETNIRIMFSCCDTLPQCLRLKT